MRGDPVRIGNYKFIVTLPCITDDFHQQSSADSVDECKRYTATLIQVLGFVGQVTQKTKRTRVFSHYFGSYAV